MTRSRRPLRVGLAVLVTALATGQASDGGRLAARLRPPRVAAHRGGYGFPDSNTVARFEISRHQGVDIVETDLRLSKDGVVFLFHNERLDRRTSCTGLFRDHTAAELAHCHLRGLERGPDRFEDALRWSRGRVVVDAELKTPEVTEPAIDLVRRYRAYDWVYFQVGNGLDLYRRVRAYDARVALEAAPRGPDATRFLAELLAANDPRLMIIQLHPELLSSEVLGALRERGKLASIDTWRLAPESAEASCALAFSREIDIAVTDAPESCVRQRDAAKAPSAL